MKWEVDSPQWYSKIFYVFLWLSCGTSRGQNFDRQKEAHQFCLQKNVWTNIPAKTNDRKNPLPNFKSCNFIRVHLYWLKWWWVLFPRPKWSTPFLYRVCILSSHILNKNHVNGSWLIKSTRISGRVQMGLTLFSHSINLKASFYLPLIALLIILIAKSNQVQM